MSSGDLGIKGDPMRVMLMSIFLGNIISDLESGKVDEVILELQGILDRLNLPEEKEDA